MKYVRVTHGKLIRCKISVCHPVWVQEMSYNVVTRGRYTQKGIVGILIIILIVNVNVNVSGRARGL